MPTIIFNFAENLPAAHRQVSVCEIPITEYQLN